jgi:ABC-2 type transport system permease protein
MFRGYHLTRHYISWVIVFNFYALTISATVALIGVAAGDYKMSHLVSHYLLVGQLYSALLWISTPQLKRESGATPGHGRR